MGEVKDILGKWWIPDQPNTEVSGILHIKEDGHARLETIGLFDEDNLHVIRYDTIWGHTSDNDDVSLFDCVLKSTSKTGAAFSHGTFTPSVVAIGKHVSSWNEKGNYDVRASIEELNYWARIKTISPSEDGETWHIDKKYHTITIVEIDNKTTLEIGGGSHTHYHDYGMKLDVDQQVSVFFNHGGQISFQDAKRELSHFEQFMSFATLKHVTHTHFWLYDKDDAQHPIEIFEPQEIVETEVRYWTYLFDYEAIQEDFASMIKIWYSDSTLFPIRNYLIDSVCAQGYYTSIRFLLVANASNGYYLRYVNKNLTESAYLKKMVKDFSDIDKIDLLTETEINIIGNTRNLYSHLFLKKEERPIADDEKMRDYIFILRKFVICCVFRALGLENRKINEILNNSQNYYTQKISETHLLSRK